MKRTELTNLLLNGEGSTVEFMRDDVQNDDLVKNLAAFLNRAGGIVLLGVEDDGNVSGVTRDRLEEWVCESCRTKIEPPVVPILSWVRNAEPGRDVLAVRVTHGPNRPYGLINDGSRTYYTRVGNHSWEASREELERMFQPSERLQYGQKPVPGATFDALNYERLSNYILLLGLIKWDELAKENRHGWETLLRNLQFMTESAGECVATVNGLLLFGNRPCEYLPQSGIRAICYPGVEPGYTTCADEYLQGPMVPVTSSPNGVVLDPGLADQARRFVRRNAPNRLDRWDYVEESEYPPIVLSEALENALVHRDYSIAGASVMLVLYADHLEIQSPGRLPSTMTVDRMKAGLRYARNQTLYNVMRDFHPADVRKRGVKNRIIPGMRDHNGTEPDLIEEERRFTVRLWKTRKDA